MSVPPYVYDPNATHQQPKKPMGAWKICLVIAGTTLVIILGCLGGSALLFGGSVIGIDNQIKANAADRATHLKIDSCGRNLVGVEVKFTIVNVSDVPQDYLPTFDITNAAGERIGEAASFETAVAPGNTVKGSATAFTDQKGKITCTLRSA